MNDAFKKARPILDRLEAAGHEAYFVGGSIRDEVLGLPLHDVDIATSAYPEEVQKLFPKHFDVGLEHGTVMVWYAGETYEITTFRSEDTYTDYRRPSHVTFISSLKEDLKRRDFTMNALAMDKNGKLIDYFNGVDDIYNACIRAVGLADERFEEDALRMMRAVRFSGQLGFDIEPATFAALKKHAPLLEKIAIERVTQEFNKLWQGFRWQKGLYYLLKGELALHIPLPFEIFQGFPKMLTAMGTTSLPKPDFAWALAAFLGTEKQEEESMLGALKALNRDFKMSKASGQEQAAYATCLLAAKREEAAWRTLLFTYGFETVQTVVNFIEREAREEAPWALASPALSTEKLQALNQSLPIHSRQDLAINGHDIMAYFPDLPKQMIGQYLDRALDRVLYERVENERQAILTSLADGEEAGPF